MSYVFSFFNSIQKDGKIINLEPHVHTIKQVDLTNDVWSQGTKPTTHFLRVGRHPVFLIDEQKGDTYSFNVIEKLSRYILF